MIGGFSIQIAAEGRGDFWFLHGLFEAIMDERGVAATDYAISPLHPSAEQVFAEADGPSGWQSVRRWAREHGTRSIAFMLKAGTLGVILQVDGDVARKIDPPVTPAGPPEATTPALCQRIRTDWLRHPEGTPLPEGLLIMIPTDETETWILAARRRRVATAHLEQEQDTKEAVEAETPEARDPEVRRRFGREVWRAREVLRTLPSFLAFETKLETLLARRLPGFEMGTP